MTLRKFYKENEIEHGEMDYSVIPTDGFMRTGLGRKFTPEELFDMEDEENEIEMIELEEIYE